MIKPIQIALAPTRNRPLNMFLGVVLALASMLLLLAVATYHATDPSLNTSTDPGVPVVIGNWIGPIGAFIGDLALQTLGFTAFFLPLWLGAVAWGWMRSRWAGSGWLRACGALLSLVFLPAVFGLLPWHWHWLHVIPIEGVTGRLVAGMLVTWLNLQGAWLVAGVLAAAGVYFAMAISFRAVFESIEDRWLRMQAWHDRWRNWREDRAEMRAERELAEDEQKNPGPAQRIFTGAIDAPESEAELHQPGRFAAFFKRRAKAVDGDSLNEIPAYQRVAERPVLAQTANPTSVAEPPLRPSIWDRTAEAGGTRATRVPSPAPLELGRAAAPIPVEKRVGPAVLPAAPAPRPETRQETRAAHPPAPTEIAIHERADAEVRTTTVAPRNVSGFKLPPSTLLNAGGGPQAIREDELREEAKVLVEKCAEFDVRGQVVQINPGPDGHNVRVQARGRRQVFARDRAGRRPVPGDAGRKHPHRAHGRQEHGGHPGAQPRARDHSPARRAGVGDFCQVEGAAHAGHGQGHQRAHRDRRSGFHAARADRRLDRIGQIGGHQRHDHEPAVSAPRRRRCG